jgi:hypothetical protein
MPLASTARDTILQRLTELESELRLARTALKDLRSRDPATAEIVIRAARLSRERSGLERRLELLRLDSSEMANQLSVS